jgi:hypothetical protein
VLSADPTAPERYLRAIVPRLNGRFAALDLANATITPIDAGIMNYVFRLECGGHAVYLKQALARAKQHNRLGPDLASVPPSRIRTESRALELIREALPGCSGRQVPAPLWYDAENNVLWTHDIAESKRGDTEESASEIVSLQQELQEGLCCGTLAEDTGRLLGRIHSRIEAPPLWENEHEDLANWERFLAMRTTGILARAELPRSAARVVTDLHAAGRARRRDGILSHLDAAPKNVLTDRSRRAILVDFELGASGSDPAYDPGFLAGHYLLMGENRPAMRDQARDAAALVLRGYREIGGSELCAGDWIHRAVRYAAATMLYRLYGSSPAPYLSPQHYDAIRAGGIALLEDPGALSI